MTPAEAIADVQSIPGKLASADLSAPLAKCKEVVRREIGENFATQSAPDSKSPWPPRKPRPDDDGHPLLDDTGALKAAATGLGAGGFETVGPREMQVGIDKSVKLGGIPGAQAHDRGTEVLPVRHFFASGEEGLQECEGILADGMLEVLS
jgi:hypothetical protein